MNVKREYPVLVRKFQAIVPDVTTEDIMSAAIEMGCHYETINRYLRGNVAKEKFGFQLISFLENRVKDRQNAHAE